MNSFSDEVDMYEDHLFLPSIKVSSPILEQDEGEEVREVNTETLHQPWANRRKQAKPRRSLKQLASVAEKILQGIIVIEPYFPWERDGLAPIDKKSLSNVLAAPLGNGGRKRRGGAHDDDRSDSSLGSIGKSFGNTNGSSVSRPTVTRSPAPMGIHLEEDLTEPALSQRQQLYEEILAARRQGSGRAGMPLDITSAPGASLLDESEFEVCSTLRLYPLQYFQSRDTLVGNYHSRGFYKKSAAQKMLHIDVNKTGKLYDYFVSKGWMPYGPDDVVSQLPSKADWSPIKPSAY